jgi:hypothetical protein
MRRALILTALAVAMFATTARAQSQAVISLGLTTSSYDPTRPLGQSATSIGPVLRFNLGPGFGPTIGFDWYIVGVETIVDGQHVYVGRVRVKPVMGGITYQKKWGKYWGSLSLVGGYAFAHLDFNDRAVPAFGASLGAHRLSFDAANSFVFRPQVAMWYDASPRVGITASLAYIGVRPKLRIASDVGVRQVPLDAACTVLTFGVVYGIF